MLSLNSSVSARVMPEPGFQPPLSWYGFFLSSSPPPPPFARAIEVVTARASREPIELVMSEKSSLGMRGPQLPRRRWTHGDQKKRELTIASEATEQAGSEPEAPLAREEETVRSSAGPRTSVRVENSDHASSIPQSHTQLCCGEVFT